jgi:hypothetical protein
MIWPQVPESERRQLIILLGQMAVRHLAAAPAMEGYAYDDHRPLALGGPQDSGAASRSVRGSVRPPIHPPADGAPSGVDPTPIGPRRTRPRVRLGTPPSTGY